MGVVKDLQVLCILRKGFLQQQKLAAANAPRPAVAVPGPNASFSILIERRSWPLLARARARLAAPSG